MVPKLVQDGESGVSEEHTDKKQRAETDKTWFWPAASSQ